MHIDIQLNLALALLSAKDTEVVRVFVSKNQITCTPGCHGPGECFLEFILSKKVGFCTATGPGAPGRCIWKQMLPWQRHVSPAQPCAHIEHTRNDLLCVSPVWKRPGGHRSGKKTSCTLCLHSSISSFKKKWAAAAKAAPLSQSCIPSQGTSLKHQQQLKQSPTHCQGCGTIPCQGFTNAQSPGCSSTTLPNTPQ